MAHTIAEKEKLLRRVRRLKARLDVIQHAIDSDADPATLLEAVTIGRGMINTLMAEVLADHIRVHVLRQDGTNDDLPNPDAETLIEVMQAYIGHRQ